MKQALRFLLGILFGFRSYNEEVLKAPGPLLLLPNHVSWLDWLFLLVCSDGDWKSVVSARTAQTSWVHRLIMLNRFTFPLDTDSPYAAKHMAAYLAKGGRLLLFPEGRISRTGTLLRIFEGTGFLLHKTQAKVITCFIRGAEYLPTSPNPNQKRLFPRISVHFGEALTPPKIQGKSAIQARSFYTNWIRDQMIAQRFAVELQFGPQGLLDAITQSVRNAPGRVLIEDATGRLTGRQLLVGARVLSHVLRSYIPADARRVGVLLPNVKAVPVLLCSLWVMGKEAAMLNFSTGSAVMLQCVKLAGVRQVITSRAFVEKAKLDWSSLEQSGVEVFYLEDIQARISNAEKVAGYVKHRIREVLNVPFFTRQGGNAEGDGGRTAVVLFTSGSEGVPKGVELTHRNILSNVIQMLAVNDITDRDRLFNAMPIFHSFGLTVGLILPMIRGFYVYLYPSPLHYRVVSTAVYGVDATILIATNTFLNGYAKKAHSYDFRSLRFLFAAAEKLQDATAATWARRFGVSILEGYGATECSPCVSVNTAMAVKFGSAGRLLPGMEYRLEPIEGISDGGRLWVKGPNVMKGYLNPERKTGSSDSAVAGWYDTGDIAEIDDDGFVFIRGRMKRFAKISGEMVSLTAIEDAVAGAFPQYGPRVEAAVVSFRDELKGERLVLVTNEPRLEMDEVRAAIRMKGLANLAVPKEIRVVPQIPKLGTGKVNYRELEAGLS
ncbi:MAG: AMP-binding protein [Verrucomicrobiota bacterium]